MKFGFSLLLLLGSYLCIGLAPLFLIDIRAYSPFTLVFCRFFGASMIELILIGIVFFLLKGELTTYFRLNPHRSPKNENVTTPQQTIGLWQLVKLSLHQYYLAPNKHFLKGRAQLAFLIWLGFNLVTISVPTLYLSYDISGVAVSIIAINGLSILCVAIFNWIRKEEEIDLLKMIYLGLILAAVITIAYSSSIEFTPLTFQGMITIGISMISFVIFLVGLGNDPTAHILLLDEWNISRRRKVVAEQLLMLQKALLKLFGIHFFGALLIIPVAALLAFLNPLSLEGSIAGSFLFVELPQFGSILQNPAIIGLIVVCTAIPYFLIMYTSIVWPRHALKQGLWAGIFSLAELLLGLYLGWLVWNETIKVDYIAFTTLFIAAVILIRFFAESGTVQRVLFLVKLTPGHSDAVMQDFLKIKELDTLDFVTGDYDIIMQVTVRSMRRISEIAEACKRVQDVKELTYCVIGDEKKKKGLVDAHRPTLGTNFSAKLNI